MYQGLQSLAPVLIANAARLGFSAVYNLDGGVLAWEGDLEE